MECDNKTTEILIELKNTLLTLNKNKRSVGVTIGINTAISEINKILGIKEDLEYIINSEDTSGKNIKTNIKKKLIKK